MADKSTNTAGSGITAKLKSGGDQLAGWALLAPGEVAQAASRMKPSTLAWIGIALAAVVLLSVNIIASALFKNATADLTESGLYTISDSTKSVLSKIDEPIDVKVYFSERLGELSAGHKRFFDRVRGLFERYQSMTGGLLSVRFVDPTPFSDAEDRAVAAGLNGVQMGAGENGYFGLVATNSTDDREIVPFFSPQREAYLEYDMTKLVHKLAVAKKPVIGVISGLQLDGGMTPQRQQIPPWQVMGQIREFFDVEMLTQSVTEIPDKIDVLLLVNPVAIGNEAAYAIDQFVLRGGRLIAFLDPVSEIGSMFNPMMRAGGMENPEIAKLLKAWGVQFDAKKVVGDIGRARRVQTGGATGAISDYVAWQNLKADSFRKGEVMADGVTVMNIATPGYFEAVKDATTKLQPIITSTNQAMLIDKFKFVGRPDPIGLLREYKPGGKSYVLAARVTGEIKTAFPDGKPKPEDDKKADAAAKKPEDAKADGKEAEAEAKAPKQLTSGKINAILVGDSDMLYDEFWVSVREVFGQRMLIPNAHNIVFLMNALENLSGGEALAGLRGRGVEQRPFDMVDEIRRESERKYRKSEQALMAKLTGLQDRLKNVAQKTGEDGTVRLALSEQDQAAVEEARAEMIQTRRELRDVKHALRADIENLEARVKFINIALVPLLIACGGFAFAYFRRRKTA